MNEPTCEYGCPVLCAQPATWECLSHKVPFTIFACDRHAPLMVDADEAHRLSYAPPLPLHDLKAYVTALAWQAVLIPDRERIRRENARAAFRLAREEFQMRSLTEAQR